MYTPALKLADWLENYAHSLELNVWTSSTVEHCSYDEKTKKWAVDVTKPDGSKRTFHVNHVIMAPGIGAGSVNMPKYPGMVNQSEYSSCLQIIDVTP